MAVSKDTLLADTLSDAVDNVHQAIFEGRTISSAARTAAARFLASKQGLPRAYANMFALSDAERRNGIKVFTGERMTSASARHIAGEETCVALLELNVETRAVQQALARATEGMTTVLHAQDGPKQRTGTFCCAKCTVSVWRHLSAGGLDHQAERLAAGMRYLRQHRDDQAEWRRFPFAYTVYALTGIQGPEATRELRHAAPSLERRIKRAPGADRYAQRRHAIFTRALERI